MSSDHLGVVTQEDVPLICSFASLLNRQYCLNKERIQFTKKARTFLGEREVN